MPGATPCTCGRWARRSRRPGWAELAPGRRVWGEAPRAAARRPGTRPPRARAPGPKRPSGRRPLEAGVHGGGGPGGRSSLDALAERPSTADGSLRDETLLVLALSLGASGVSALISFIGSVTRPGGLKDQAATLNASAAPGRPWLDLAWQLFGITTALVPVALVAHFLLREGRGLRTLGFDRTRPWPDLGRGAAVAAVIGSTGIAFYLAARGLGFNLTVVPEALPDVWWKYPVLILSAVQNSVLEEVIVVGTCCAGSTSSAGPGASLAASSVLRGSYHLYQGIGGFVGNMVMGVVFVYLYRRWGRVGPLVVAHSLLDIGAFVGYALLAGKVTGCRRREPRASARLDEQVAVDHRTARPVSRVRPPRSSRADPAGRTTPEAGEVGAAQALGPEGGQRRVGAAGDRVLVDADVREEAAGDEVVAAGRVLGAGRGDDAPLRSGRPVPRAGQQAVHGLSSATRPAGPRCAARCPGPRGARRRGPRRARRGLGRGERRGREVQGDRAVPGGRRDEDAAAGGEPAPALVGAGGVQDVGRGERRVAAQRDLGGRGEPAQRPVGLTASADGGRTPSRRG